MLSSSSLISSVYHQNSITSRANLAQNRVSKKRDKFCDTLLILRFILSIILLGGVSFSCLPVDSEPPECFPDEQCARGFMCLNGQCVTPDVKNINVNLSCLGGVGCGNTLEQHEVQEACLIIEQPHALLSVPFDLQAARTPEGVQISAPLMPGNARFSTILFTAPSEEMSMSSLCALPDSDIERLQLHRSCPSELGCVLRLRQEVMSFEAETLKTLSLINVDFNGPNRGCAESLWSNSSPVEECGGGDHDCDGFIDEGLRCVSTDLMDP